ncbi:ABC transporter substrate-binding protein [Corynebacterium uberis]|uniref:ABC transporter substrate-binding protein n=1 Tax=Corynebacterium TaxID=1716 RepID=UPI001D0A1724|nr:MULTISPECIES: ABC transporter substrate-binding protein [Corynebacterium]MCZ9308182.1 ABC transporter substrate-binding protein [Corynebacterium sp. c6VSa_13]UDL74826.1 ABC transporter substrate-binding protein [Corynebacterium uberis]UDL76986.1 ABC transporter substrate-binding protein [Corynebacterium uberis]UDL79197.1 ABC transporter substrate-binding protein [Corynebacterium uberis]UDL81402.1 ABC transporter substrate-binding protein [Corynebacterium uberis]
MPQGARPAQPRPARPHPARSLSALAALSLAAALAVSGCAAGSTGASISGETTVAPAEAGVRLAVTGAPASLDFTTTSGVAIPKAVMGNVYETLVRIDAQGQIQPWLATSWDTSADATTYTFHLREGVRFSNGDPFDAASAKFSLDRVRSQAWTNGLKAQLDVIDHVTVLDPHTLRVQLTQRSTTWLWSLGTLVGAMMTPGGIDDLASNPVGTGPFTVQRWVPGRALVYRANPTYWGTAPGSPTVTVRYFPDGVSATNALESGDVDVVWGIQSPELLDKLRAKDTHTVQVGTTNGEFLLTMNHRRAPFSDVRVRRAVMHAVDRQAIIDTVWSGYGVDTGGVPVPPSDPWYSPSTRYPFDPQRARDLLEEAGFATDGTDARLAVTITVPSLPYAQDAAELIFSQLRDVGFQVRLASAEFPAVWLAQVLKGHDYDMSLISHDEPRDIPTIFGNPDYYLGYDSPRTRALLADAASGTAEHAPQAMARAVDSIMDDAAADTLMNVANIVVSDPHIAGIDPNMVTDSLPLPALHRRTDTPPTAHEEARS